jgi:hypothetical protein
LDDNYSGLQTGKASCLTLLLLGISHFLQPLQGALFTGLQNGKTQVLLSLLVNIIAALGCRFSDRLAVQATQDAGQHLGDQFYAEAEMLWEKENLIL